MRTVEKMSITLPPDMAAAVREAVAIGEYASASEVIREALRLWRAEQAAREQEVEELRRAWHDGIRTGPVTHLDFADVKTKGRAALTRERARRS